MPPKIIRHTGTLARTIAARRHHKAIREDAGIVDLDGFSAALVQTPSIAHVDGLAAVGGAVVVVAELGPFGCSRQTSEEGEEGEEVDHVLCSFVSC
jgi:hypothetical protein